MRTKCTFYHGDHSSRVEVLFNTVSLRRGRLRNQVCAFAVRRPYVKRFSSPCDMPKPNSLDGGRKHLRKTWFLAVLVHMTWNLSMIRRLIKFCCLSCGTTKAANFTSTDCFFFFFLIFFGSRCFSFIHIFRLELLFWWTYFLTLEDIEEVALKLRQVPECALWGLCLSLFSEDTLDFRQPTLPSTS